MIRSDQVFSSIAAGGAEPLTGPPEGSDSDDSSGPSSSSSDATVGGKDADSSDSSDTEAATAARTAQEAAAAAVAASGGARGSAGNPIVVNAQRMRARTLSITPATATLKVLSDWRSGLLSAGELNAFILNQSLFADFDDRSQCVLGAVVHACRSTPIASHTHSRLCLCLLGSPPSALVLKEWRGLTRCRRLR